MSIEENRAIIRRFVEEVWNKGDLAVADELVASHVVDHNPLPEQPPGVEGIKQVVATFRTAFPDVNFIIDDLIAEGDMVVVRWTGGGAHKGEFLGVPPTNRHVAITGIDIFRVVGGQIAERWANQDDLGLLRQLGVIELAREAGR